MRTLEISPDERQAGRSTMAAYQSKTQRGHLSIGYNAGKLVRRFTARNSSRCWTSEEVKCCVSRLGNRIHEVGRDSCRSWTWIKKAIFEENRRRRRPPGKARRHATLRRGSLRPASRHMPRWDAQTTSSTRAWTSSGPSQFPELAKIEAFAAPTRPSSPTKALRYKSRFGTAQSKAV